MNSQDARYARTLAACKHLLPAAQEAHKEVRRDHTQQNKQQAVCGHRQLLTACDGLLQPAQEAHKCGAIPQVCLPQARQLSRILHRLGQGHCGCVAREQREVDDADVALGEAVEVRQKRVPASPWAITNTALRMQTHQGWPSAAAHQALPRHLAPLALLAAQCPLLWYYQMAMPPTRASLLQQHVRGRPAIGARFVCGCRGRGAVGAAPPLAAAGGARLCGGARSCLQRGVLEGVADLRLGSQQQGNGIASSANKE